MAVFFMLDGTFWLVCAKLYLMRMCIDIDEDLMRRAMECTGLRTKKAVVEAALRLLIQTRSSDVFAVSSPKLSSRINKK